jgi:hypothetical protein
MYRWELIVEVVTDEAYDAWVESYDPTTGEYGIELTPTRYKLDTWGEEPIDITYQVADIRTLDNKKSSYSKSMSLPDTPNNRKVFDSLFWVNFDRGFNPKRKTKCYVKENGIITFEGYIQVQGFNNEGWNGPSYQVVLLSSLRSFKSSIADVLLQELDWSGIDEYWDYEHIQDSWNPAIIKEVFYPFIDYGWNIRMAYLSGWGLSYYSPGATAPIGASVFTENFYPAIYLKNYIDRIFQTAGFTYRSEFFNSDFFKALIIPYNGGRYMQRIDLNDTGKGSFAQDKYFSVGNNVDHTLLDNDYIITATTFNSLIKMNTATGAGLSDQPIPFWSTVNNNYTQNRTDVYSQMFQLSLKLRCVETVFGDPIDLSNPDPIANIEKVSLLICRKSTPFSSPTDLGDSQIERFIYYDPTIPAYEVYPKIASSYDDVSNVLTVDLDTLYNNESYHDYGYDNQYFPTHLVALGYGENLRYYLSIKQVSPGRPIKVEELSSSRLKNQISLNVIHQEKIDIKNIVPQNVKCYDLMQWVMNMFNLYIEPDKDDDSILIIEPRKDFINSGRTLDWSDRADIEQNIDMKIISEITNKLTEFKWNQGNDFLTKNYQVRYGYTFGEVTYNNLNEYASGKTAITTGFSSTPSTIIKGGLDPYIVPAPFLDDSAGIIIPDFTEDPTTPVYKLFPDADFKSSGVRILFAKKRMTCTFSIPNFYKEYFYFGLPGYGIQSTGLSAPAFPAGYYGKMEWYPYAGTLDDLYTPTFDLNWGAPLGLYYPYSVAGYSSPSVPTRNYPQYNLFNTYWYDYLSQLNNKTSRVITLTMKLSPEDIANFTFRDRIFLRVNHPRLGFSGGAYFTVNAITGYNPSTDAPCKVELLLLGDSGVLPATSIPSGGGGSVPVGGGGAESAPPPSS